jgi:acetyl-CoA carboxylase biotin carboxylase subunit
LIKKILIANRGEIAVRIIRACRELGITSAVMYSDADKTSLHTRMADESYHIGESAASESYLNKEKIIRLAKEIKADAIHPGYGFFAENSHFIETLEKNKINFIGPSSSSVALMGNKTEARKLMAKSNVPIVPGTTNPVDSVKEGLKIAEEIGYPVLLKAVAGGGGKGMRKINSVKEFKSGFEATKREALKSFANDEVYIEKFINNPRHIEVQVFGDKKGNYLHLFERECSIQRRHQKIIEESPSPFVDEKTRQKITSAAINAAKACGYFNAGTIEFLMDANENFYFLEMNTRLQVEHPVTEFITGKDLVKEQISVASGNELSFKQNDLKINGHALECRIYAEDPANNFLPSTGKILNYIPPSGPGVRVDSGFDSGSEITIHYDPLISKLICWSEDRTYVINRMLRALSEYILSGITTNISFLKFILNDKSFRQGKFNINFLSDDYMHSFIKLQNFDELNETEKIVTAFSAVLKTHSIESVVKHKQIDKMTNWQEQMYE